jgi:hypothetical protein
MSDASDPPEPPVPLTAVPEPPPIAPPPPPPPRSGCLTALMVIVGVILLLPGLCALLFGAGSLFSSHFDPGFGPFVVVGLLVGFGGVMLIRAAIRGPKS